MDNDKTIYSRVLFIGPHLKNRGGISSVLASYKAHLPEFHHLATNSLKGTVPGLFNFARTLVLLPFVRLFTPYRILDIHGSSLKSWRRKSLIIRLGKLLGFKISFHCHSAIFKDFVEDKGVDNIKSVFEKCDCVFALSDTWKQYFDETFGLGKFFTLNNMSDTPASYQANIDKPNDDIVRFVFMAWFDQRKGIFDLLDVMAKNVDYFRGKAKIVLCGRYNEKMVQRFIAEHHLEDIAEFKGWVAGEEKDKVFRECDILLMPSYAEGLPVSILESFTYAMPVITTPVGAIPEVVKYGENGVLFSPGDQEALFRAMKFYCDNQQEIKRQGQNSKELSKKFLPDAIIRRLTKVLETL